MPGQFALTPKNRMLRVGGSRVPLSGPRQIAVRIMYKTPQRTSSVPSPIRNILASQFIAAPHNRTGINRGKVGFVPAGTSFKNLNWFPGHAAVWPARPYALILQGGANAQCSRPYRTCPDV